MTFLSTARATRMAKVKRVDTQRSKEYAAEAALKLGDLNTRLLTLADVQAYADRVTDLAWFRRRWGSRRIKAVQKRGVGGYNPAGTNTIHIGLNVGSTAYRGAPKMLVLHEIAHCITSLPPDQERNWHGPAFARTMLELIGFEFGDEFATAFRIACREHHVRIGSPTPLREPDRVPAPRPTPRTYRVQIGDETIVLEATNLLGALERLTVSPIYRSKIKAADQVRVWKSRATSKAAGKR